jgi:trk system potassium uptake protein TrkA
MHVVVAGCGRVGSQLAEYLKYERHKVTLIDRDAASLERFAGKFRGKFIQGDISGEEILLKAGIKKANGFAAVTDSDDANLAAAELAVKNYGIERTVARVYKPVRQKAFSEKGITNVCGSVIIAERLREKLFKNERSIVQQDSSDAGVQVVEFGIGREADGKPVGGLSYGISSSLLVLMRDGRELPFDENTPLASGDQVVMTLRKEGWKVVREFMGADLDDSAMFGSMAYDLPGNAVEGEPPEARVIIVGCTQVGIYLAQLLEEAGHHITLMDEDPALLRKPSPGFSGNLVEGSISSEQSLIAAGIKEADAFVATTRIDEANSTAVKMARDNFRVRHVVARVFEPSQEVMYETSGIPYVSATRSVSQVLLDLLLVPTVRAKSSCLHHQYDVVEFSCPPAWKGKRVRAAMNSSGVVFAYIIRRGTGYMPEPNFVLHAGDTITALATSRKFQKLDKYLHKQGMGSGL